MADVRAYYVPIADASHPMKGWYVKFALTAMPIGPFPNQDRADAAVEALERALRPAQG